MSFTHINAVAFKENGIWVAQCLEFNLVSCAENLEDLPNELLGQILDQIEADRAAGREPFSRFARAPQKYWDLYAKIQAKSRPIRPRRSWGQKLRDLVKPRFQLQLFPAAAEAA